MQVSYYLRDKPAWLRRAYECWLRIRNLMYWVWRGFKPIEGVHSNAYIQLAPELGVTKADPTAINAAARTLEAALLMAENVPQDYYISLEMTKLELASFVCYMRQLDQEYRALLIEFAASAQPVHKAKFTEQTPCPACDPKSRRQGDRGKKT